MIRKALFFGIFLLVSTMQVYAANPSQNEDTHQSLERIEHLAVIALESKYQNAKIQFINLQTLANNPSFVLDQEVSSVSLVEDKPNGVATFRIKGVVEKNGKPREVTQLIQLPYEAWVKTWVAKKRIFPNTKLRAEDFRIAEINVAQGVGREYRGIIANADFSIQGFESKQTILEGNFLTTSAFRKEPSVRRGDLVKMELLSGGLVLTTQAVVQEPASVGDRVRVLTQKSKREMVGQLKDDQRVEVRL